MPTHSPPPTPADLFPFTEYFADAPQPLFKGQAYEEDWEKAQVGGSECLSGCGACRPVCCGCSADAYWCVVACRGALCQPCCLLSILPSLVWRPPPTTFPPSTIFPPQGCFRHLRTMFQELEEIRPFELLKSQADRVNYLMTKQVGSWGGGRRWGLAGCEHGASGRMRYALRLAAWSVLTCAPCAPIFTPPQAKIVAMTCTHAALKRK